MEKTKDGLYFNQKQIKKTVIKNIIRNSIKALTALIIIYLLVACLASNTSFLGNVKYKVINCSGLNIGSGLGTNYGIITTVSDSSTINTTTLNNTITKYSSVAVYYKNLKSGYVYTNNANQSFFAASVIKAPYCLYVYSLAEKGQANLNRMYTYMRGMCYDGTGIIKNKPYGSTFTESQLLEYAIRYSDNIAFSILISSYGRDGFKSFLQNNDINTLSIGTVTGAYINADQAGQFANLIYNYIQNDNSKYASKFKTDLMSTSNPMITASYPIARKYGWANKSFNDMAIVYAPSPYILVILSNHDVGNANDFNMFRDISTTIENFNNSNFK